MQEAEELQKRFSSLSDRKLAEMILLHADDYRPEALDIAKQEMVNRNLSVESLKGIIDGPPPKPLPEEWHELKAPRIRGWLVLPAAGFVLNPFLILDDIIRLSLGKNHHPIIYFMGLIDIGLLVFCCLIAWRFLNRKRNIPSLAIAFYLAAFISDLLCGFCIYYFDLFKNFSLSGYVKLSLIVCVIWIPYFLFSKRVKRTFIVE